MNLIFLDFDGVLNSYSSANHFYETLGGNGAGGWADLTSKEAIRWCPSTVANLRYLMDSTNAMIVISSSWRLIHSLSAIRHAFYIYGLNPDRVYAATPQDTRGIDDSTILMAKGRGAEISHFIHVLESHHDIIVDNYVIIDDDVFDMLPHQKPFIVQTDPEVGLTMDDVHKALEILNRR